MGGGVYRRATISIVVVWAYLVAFTSSQLQRQQQWQPKYNGPLTSGHHLRSGQQSSAKPHPAAGRQLANTINTNFSYPGKPGRQFGQDKLGNQRIITGKQQEVGNQGILSGGSQQRIFPYDDLIIVQVPKDVLPVLVPTIPIASERILQQAGLFGGQNSGQTGGYNYSLSSNLNTSSNRSPSNGNSVSPTRNIQTNQIVQPTPRRPLQPSQTSVQSAQRVSISNINSGQAGRLNSAPSSNQNRLKRSSSNRQVQSSPRQAQPIIEDIRDGPHADGSYYFKYGQTDGTIREEGGELIPPCELRVTGNYFYEAPNGEIIHREYVADGFGHREFPAGSRPDVYTPPRRVPVPVPMPAGGMPPCDNGQYRPMGNDGQRRPNGTKECDGSLGFFKFGNKCYKPFLDQRRSWPDAVDKCYQEGLVIAKIDGDPKELAKYMIDTYPWINPYGDDYWVGASGDGVNMRWLQNNDSLPGPNSSLWSSYSGEADQCLGLRNIPESPYVAFNCLAKIRTLCEKGEPTTLSPLTCPLCFTYDHIQQKCSVDITTCPIRLSQAIDAPCHSGFVFDSFAGRCIMTVPPRKP